MPSSARACPHCGGLNAEEVRRCYSCEQPLPGRGGHALANLAELVTGKDALGTKSFFAVCVAVFVFCVVDGRTLPIVGQFSPSTLVRFGALAGGLDVATGLVVSQATSEPWRYLSAVFCHASVLHIVFNMMTLGSFGSAIEAEIGSARLLVTLVVTGVVGFVVSDLYFVSVGRAFLTVGASGSISGLLGLLIAYWYVRGDDRWKRMLVTLLVYSVIMELAIARINHAAHLGGLLAGLPFGALFAKEVRPRSLNRFFSRTAALAMLASLGSIVLCEASPEWRERRRHELSPGRTDRRGAQPPSDERARRRREVGQR